MGLSLGVAPVFGAPGDARIGLHIAGDPRPRSKTTLLGGAVGGNGLLSLLIFYSVLF